MNEQEQINALKQEVAHLTDRVSFLEKLLGGAISGGVDGSGGAMGMLRRLVATVYGDKESGTPGLVQAVNRLVKLSWIGYGMLVAMQVGWMIYTHFAKGS